MSMKLLVCLTNLVMFLGLAPTVAIGPAPRVLDPAAVDRFVAGYLEQTGVPGAAIVIIKGDQVVYVTGYGHDSAGEPVTPNTPMRIASLSKSFTALAVMQLAEQGKLKLDAPVRNYLPQFKLADPRGSAITVRQLLNQTSGMADATFPEMSLLQPASPEAAVTRMQTAKLVADPGTDWNYHNPNYHIAARLVEVISREPFAAYLERYVFDPLDMEASTTIDCGQESPSFIRGHILAYGYAVALPEPDYFCTGSGAVVTTANDMATWLVLQNNAGAMPDGTRVISAEGTQTMHTPPASDGIYGMGWYQTTPAEGNGPVRISHSGVMGTFSAYQGLFPSNGYGIAVLLNASSPWADPYAVAKGLVALVEGVPPELGASTGFIVESIFAVLTLVTLLLGIWGLVRARVWASRHVVLPGWRNALVLLPYMIPVVVFVTLPNLGEVMMGRDGNWTIALYTFVALVVWLGVAALCSAGIIIARIAHLVR